MVPKMNASHLSNKIASFCISLLFERITFSLKPVTVFEACDGCGLDQEYTSSVCRTYLLEADSCFFLSCLGTVYLSLSSVLFSESWLSFCSCPLFFHFFSDFWRYLSKFLLGMQSPCFHLDSLNHMLTPSQPVFCHLT